MPKRVLVVAAHPDDEVLGCGGTIARLVSERQEVAVAVLGEGVTARAPTRRQAKRPQVRALQIQSRQAAQVLGVRHLSHVGLPDNRFDAKPLLEIVKLIEVIVKRFRPEVVYTHHAGDLNIDHRITFEAVLTATRPLSGCPVRELYSFEVPSSTEWAFTRIHNGFRPNVFVDISATLRTKLAAMQRYASEVRPAPHPRSSETLDAIARRWGSVIGVDYAEAFELIRLVR